MTEQVEQEKKTMDPTEVYSRSIFRMEPRQMRGHLRRKARHKGSMMDGAWAVILSTVFENTTTEIGGKVSAYLR
jgi:hypothetical protein